MMPRDFHTYLHQELKKKMATVEEYYTAMKMNKV